MAYGSISVDQINNTTGYSLGAGNATQMKNRIINGAMVVDQRNAGASVTNAAATKAYITDRWYIYGTQASKFTAQQNAGAVTPPAGFVNYLGITSSSAYTVGSSEQFFIAQIIEGYNVADLNWGTANAKTVTLSFWVRSSLTGTFGGSLIEYNGSALYPFSYTINSANTWEQKSITIAGPSIGSWSSTTDGAIAVTIGLGMGSTISGPAGTWTTSIYKSSTGATSVVGTSGATFYITGLQFEVGSAATGYEYRQYTNEFQLCQRYYQKVPLTYGAAISATTLGTGYNYAVVMRANPTATLLTSTPYAEIPNTTGYTASGAGISGYYYPGGAEFRVSGFSGMTTGRAPFLLDNNQISLSAEL